MAFLLLKEAVKPVAELLDRHILEEEMTLEESAKARSSLRDALRAVCVPGRTRAQGEALFDDLREVIRQADNLRRPARQRFLKLLRQGYCDANFGTEFLGTYPSLFEADVYRSVDEQMTGGKSPSPGELEEAAANGGVS